MKTSKRDQSGGTAPQFDDVLKRMLSTPPKQHKDEKVGKKPAPKKPAK